MKTLSDHPGLIGEVLSRAKARQERCKARAERRQALCNFVVAAVVRPVVGFAVGVVIALYLCCLLTR